MSGALAVRAPRVSDAAIEVESGGAIASPAGTLFGASIAAWRERTRRELGIAAGRAVEAPRASGRATPPGAPRPDAIVTAAGHQAFLWHPGILAKFVQARRVAGDGGAVVHLVVDQDVYEPALVRVPVRREGALGAVMHRFAPPTPAAAAAAMAMPAFPPRPYDGPAPASASIADGLERARAALEEARGAPNAPLQLATALSALMTRWVGPTRLVAASALLRTTFGGAFVEMMRRDPRRCAESFNRALAADPRAARPLRDGADPELPLWALGPGGRRERVTASRLAAAPPGSTWLPRAFLLSAFMRLAVADRFVHGTGARRYERATEAWMRDWLDVDLPPIDVASATLRLPLADEGGALHAPVTAHARRRAWWDPEWLDGAERGANAAEAGDDRRAREAALAPRAPGAQKAALLASIAELPRRSSERRAAYRRLLERLDVLRGERVAKLARLDERIAEDRDVAAALELARDRTWPFVYFDQPSLDAVFPPRASAASPASSASGSGR